MVCLKLDKVEVLRFELQRYDEKICLHFHCVKVLLRSQAVICSYGCLYVM